MKYPLVKTLFDPVLDNIASHLKSILRDVGRVDYLILVGGFARSSLLQTRFRREFEKQYGLRVLVPRDCSLAVVMGAVLFGHDPAEISARRVRYSYGIECVDPTLSVTESGSARGRRFRTRDYDEEEDYPLDSLLRSSLSIERSAESFGSTSLLNRSAYKPTGVVGSTASASLFRAEETHDKTRCFATFVRKNQEVRIDGVFEHPFMPFYDHQTEADIDVYESDLEETRYVTERGVRKVAEMKLPMPNSHLGQNRVIEICMKFGLTEITVSSIDRSSGQKVEKSVKIDFLKN